MFETNGQSSFILLPGGHRLTNTGYVTVTLSEEVHLLGEDSLPVSFVSKSL